MPNYLLKLTMMLVALVVTGCSEPTPAEPTAAESAPAAEAHPAHASDADPAASEAEDEAEDAEETADEGWEPLFDGETLEGWEVTRFGGEGEVAVEDGRISLGFGNSLTGITWEDGDALPTTNYEVALEAMRVDGTDFFCALTFPVNDSHCTLVVGGWGGTVVGLSSIDNFDASQNETTTLHTFDEGQWYAVRVRVEPERIQAWLDGEQVVDQSIEGRGVGIRPEVNLSRPLGVASWDTAAALRDIRLRELED